MDSLRMRSADWLLIGLMSVLWSGSFFLGKLALAELPPASVVLWRFGLGALVLLPALWLSGGALPRSPRLWLDLGLVGVLNKLLPYGLICWAQLSIASGTAAILNAATPLFTIVLAHLWTADEKLTATRLAGVAVGVAGVAVMIGPDAVGGLRTDLMADLACLGACLCYAIGGLYGRRFRGQPVSQIAAGEMLASAVLMLPIALAIDGTAVLAMPSARVVVTLMVLAVFSTALASWLYFRVLARVGAGNVLLVLLLTPVSAVLLGTLILAEPLLGRQLAGMALIALGLAAIDGRLLRFATVSAPGSRARPGR